MRYDTPIYFQLIRQGIYDPKTGDYADSDPVETKSVCRCDRYFHRHKADLVR